MHPSIKTSKKLRKSPDVHSVLEIFLYDLKPQDLLLSPKKIPLLNGKFLFQIWKLFNTNYKHAKKHQWFKPKKSEKIGIMFH